MSLDNRDWFIQDCFKPWPEYNMDGMGNECLECELFPNQSADNAVTKMEMTLRRYCIGEASTIC